MLSDELTLHEEMLTSILEGTDFTTQRRQVIRWWNDFVHPDDREMFQPLLDKTMAIINEMEIIVAESYQYEHQRNIAFEKLAEAEQAIRDKDEYIDMLHLWIHENFPRSSYARMLEDVGDELGADVSWEGE